MMFKRQQPTSKYHQIRDEVKVREEEVDYHYHHKIYRTHTRHFRYQPIKHWFQYPLFYFGLEVDKLSEGGGLRVKRRRRRIMRKEEEGKEKKGEENEEEEEEYEYEEEEIGGWLGWLDRLMWGYNRWGWYSLWDEDYLINVDNKGGKGKGSKLGLREKLELVMKRELEVVPKFGRIELVTTPRVLGYSFNPVSFYFCYLPNGQLELVIYEVHNTFGERHCYFLYPNTEEDDGQGIQFPRQFHVSPFNDRQGHYVTQLQDPNLANQLYVKLTIQKENLTMFMAEVYGSSEPATVTTLLHCFLAYPITALLTFPRILYQAYLLHYVKLLPVYNRPPPLSTSQLFLPPTKLEAYYFELFRSWLTKVGEWNEVTISIHRPGEGSSGGNSRIMVHKFQGRIQLYLHSYDLVTDLAYRLRGENFLPIWSETYMRGGWSTDHLSPLLTCLLRYPFRSPHDPPPPTGLLEGWILGWCQATRSLFNSRRWREGSELALPYLTEFRTQLRNLTTREGDPPSGAPLPPCCLVDQHPRSHPVTNDGGSYLLALPLHHPTPSSYHPFDHPSPTHPLWYHPLLHWCLLLLGLTLMTLDHLLFARLATFHPAGDPTLVTRRHYTILRTLLPTTGDAPQLLPYGYHLAPTTSSRLHPAPLLPHPTTPPTPDIEEGDDATTRLRKFITALQVTTLTL